MHMKIQLFASLLALVSVASHADGNIGIHVGSWHSKPGFNNFNPGVYYKSDDGWVIGTFQNSLDRNTTYVGGVIETRNKVYSLSLNVGTGYNSPLVLFPAPSVLLRKHHRIIYLPEFGKQNPSHVVSYCYQF